MLVSSSVDDFIEIIYTSRLPQCYIKVASDALFLLNCELCDVLTFPQLCDVLTFPQLCDVLTSPQLCDVLTSPQLCDVLTSPQLCDVLCLLNFVMYYFSSTLRSIISPHFCVMCYFSLTL